MTNKGVRLSTEQVRVFPTLTREFPKITKELRRRDLKGYFEYQRHLTTWDGRDSTQDLVEELLDAMVYARKLRLEGKVSAAFDFVVTRILYRVVRWAMKVDRKFWEVV